MNAKTIALVAGLSLVLAWACQREAARAGDQGAGAAEPREQEVATMGLKLTSPAFAQGQGIPRVHTCDGDDVSPSLAWEGIPPGTASLALVVDDPDAPDPVAPKMTWVHWILYNLPPTATGLPQGVTRAALPPGTQEGLNDWKRTGYGGPCPPIGRHRYFFKLYALDARLPDLGAATKAALEKAMAGHVRARAELVGTYQR
jgi:Raf kinase inhibitor-like YbhB/YbcL family protein